MSAQRERLFVEVITSFSNLASHALDATLALVYPQPCAVCGGSVESRHDGVACARCWANAPIFQGDETLCWKCGALASAKVAEEKRRTIRCGRCDDEAFAVARACGFYDGALRASVLELKRQPHVFRRLTQLMCAAQQRAPLAEAELIVPVPLHHARERERGFNQALLLAQALARLSHVPLAEHILARCSQTRMHRAGMDAKTRRQSLAGAFTVHDRGSLSDKRVLLIDDVFTTGATASACATELKAAGASQVFVLTLARASFQLI